MHTQAAIHSAKLGEAQQYVKLADLRLLRTHQDCQGRTDSSFQHKGFEISQKTACKESGVLTSRGKRGRAQQEVGACTADEAHDIVGRLQVVPEAHILVVQHII